MQSPERLKLLLVLTATDIRAVGPNVWNGWKGQLLRELYHEAAAAMADGDPQGRRARRIERGQAEARRGAGRRCRSVPGRRPRSRPTSPATIRATGWACRPTSICAMR